MAQTTQLLYSDVTINFDWFDNSVENNADLFAGLTGQSENVCNIPRTVITKYDRYIGCNG